MTTGQQRVLGNQVEGYLLWQATITVAEQRAREFVQPMEWLTTAQRTEIEQQYVSDSLHHAQKDLERISARCLSLRGEYERRYRSPAPALRRHRRRKRVVAAGSVPWRYAHAPHSELDPS
ncbi:hypothetical protein ABT255_31455 [Streptomyces mirabilis]|uniref:hypothetical protein n=1 Tax=Streptomyces mirabilis TaxID=68239 RepID=UPI00333420D6